MSKDNGGPAYPLPDKDGFCGEGCGDGMTLRDYFAAKAMQAMVSTHSYETGGWPMDNVAAQSYDVADAMLEARK